MLIASHSFHPVVVDLSISLDHGVGVAIGVFLLRQAASYWLL